MKRLFALALLALLVAYARRERPVVANYTPDCPCGVIDCEQCLSRAYDESDDGVQPWDARTVTLASPYRAEWRLR